MIYRAETSVNIHKFLMGLAAIALQAQTTIHLPSQGRNFDFSAASATKPMKTGTALPASCTAGDMFFKTDAPSGSNLYGCVAANTWSLQSGGGSGSGTGSPNPSVSFSNAALVNVTHALGTINVLVQCYNAANQAIEYHSLAVADNNTVAVTFAAPQSGRCVVNGTGGSGSGGGGGGSTSGESNTASNTGAGGQGLFHQKFGIDLQFKNLNTASNRVSITNDPANRELDLDIVPANIDLASIGGSLNSGQIAAASRQGNGSKVQMHGGGTVTTSDCAMFDASGNVVSAGSPCGTASGGEVNTGANTGTAGVGVFDQKAGVQLQFRSVNAASNRVSVTHDTGNREIDLDVAQGNLDLAQLGGAMNAGQIAAASRQGNGSKVQMSGPSTVNDGDCARFDASGNIISAGAPCGTGGGGSGEVNTAANVGAGGTGLFHQKSGGQLQFKNVNAGSNRVTVTNDATNLEVDLDVAQANLDLAQIGGSLNAGQIASASRQGTGAKVQMSGGGTINNNDCARFDAEGNVVSAGAACEANTASNSGTGGVGVFHQKSGADLQFRNINGASSRIVVANDTTNREVDIDVVPGNIDLSTLGGTLHVGQIAATSKQGNGARLQLFGAGTPATNDCAKFDASGNIISAGAPCGSGSGGDTIQSDFGVVITQTGPGVKKIGVDTAVVPTFLTASASLDFGQIPADSCSELNIAVPGAATGDAVSAGWPHTLDAGLSGTMFVSGANTVTVRLCKATPGLVDPPNQNYRATIVRSF